MSWFFDVAGNFLKEVLSRTSRFLAECFFKISSLDGGGLGRCFILAQAGICLSATKLLNLLLQKGHCFYLFYCWDFKELECLALKLGDWKRSELKFKFSSIPVLRSSSVCSNTNFLDPIMFYVCPPCLSLKASSNSFLPLSSDLLKFPRLKLILGIIFLGVLTVFI